jgi:hypothetical protein
MAQCRWGLFADVSDIFTVFIFEALRLEAGECICELSASSSSSRRNALK